MKITKKKTVTETITYHLTEEVKYIKTITNGKETTRRLVYLGKDLYDYDLKPLYDKDLSILTIHNPCWGESKEFNNEKRYKWFDEVNLPEPEDIDINKIFYVQNSRHAFFTLDKKPIPVVMIGDYIEAHLNNYFYDIEKLRTHLMKHENVVQCSEILDIPYYNREDNKTKFLRVLVYPTSEIIQKGYDTKQEGCDIVFHKPYDINSEDFLGIKKFIIRTEYC